MSIHQRKISKFGNSFGITLPLDLLERLKMKQGDNIEVLEKDGKIILQKQEELTLPKGIGKEFMAILNEVIEEHDEAFKGLVDR